MTPNRHNIKVADPWLRWIVSGPFGGKTTLVANLRAVGIPTVDTDDVRGTLPGWRDELKRAWRRDHPLHSEWKRLDQFHYAQLLSALESGAVVVTHDPPRKVNDLGVYRMGFVHPASNELVNRADAYTDWVLANFQGTELRGKLARLSAAIAYWSSTTKKLAGYPYATFDSMESLWRAIGSGPFNPLLTTKPTQEGARDALPLRG